LGIFRKLFAAIANAAQLLQMLWTKINVCNLKSIRLNLKSIGAEKSDSENYLQQLQAFYYCPWKSHTNNQGYNPLNVNDLLGG